MAIPRPARPALVAALMIGVAACAEPAESGGTAGSPPARSEPAATEGLVLRVEQTGGFLPPTTIAARLPMVSVYADGRVFTEGPVAAVYPGPALPNVQVGEIDAAEVQALVDRALDAGVAESGDLGTPSVADAPSTRFTVVTTQETHVREVYALWEGSEDSGLTGRADGGTRGAQPPPDGPHRAGGGQHAVRTGGGGTGGLALGRPRRRPGPAGGVLAGTRPAGPTHRRAAGRHVRDGRRGRGTGGARRGP